MNWLKQEINPKVVGLLLIGILVGGSVMGFVDSKRPKPLLSSADGGAGVIEECSDQVQALEDYIDFIPQNLPPEQLEFYRSYTIQLYNAVVACVNEISIIENQTQIEEIRRIRDEIRGLGPVREAQRVVWQEAVRLANVAEGDFYRTCSQARPEAGSSADKQLGDQTKGSSGSINNASKDQTEDGDCDALEAAAREARDRADEEENALSDIDYDLEQLEQEITEINDQHERFLEDREYTIDYAQELRESRFGSAYNGSGSGTGTRQY